jgi:hypothetical protein
VLVNGNTIHVGKMMPKDRNQVEYHARYLLFDHVLTLDDV